MHPTSKSRVVTGIASPPAASEVSGRRTFAALGSSRVRGASATVWRNLFAGRSVGALVALALLAACDPRLTGDGIYLEKRVDPGGQFTGVRVEDGVGAVITVDPGRTQSVTVTGDANLVRDHIKTALEVEGSGPDAVTLLHVWVDPSNFEPVIAPRVVIARPDFSVARAAGASVELKRPAGSSAVGGPLVVGLSRAFLDAQQYPTSGAVVALADASTALLHSEAAVTGVVSADSHLDNTLGAGPCLVATTAAGSVRCND